MANLKQKYQEAVVPALSEKFGFKNPMLVPKVDKVVINMAFGIVDKVFETRPENDEGDSEYGSGGAPE